MLGLVAHRSQHRLLGATDLRGGRASGIEAAPRRREHRRRRFAADRQLGRGHERVGHRDRIEQHPRVRVGRRGVQLVARRHLAHLAEVHDGDAVADVLDDGQVVGDEHERQAVALLEVLEQVQHLGLDAHVEGRDRLVADDQRRVEHERAGDRDALALSTGELVWAAFGGPLRVDADLLERPVDDRSALRFRPPLPDVEGFAHDVADAATRVERRDRVLEDHLHLRASGAHVLRAERREIGALEHHGAGRRPGQLHHRTSGRGLATAGLADDAERFAAADVEADPGHRADDQAGAPDRELDHEVLDPEHRVVVDRPQRAPVPRARPSGHAPVVRLLACARVRSSLRSWYSGEPTG